MPEALTWQTDERCVVGGTVFQILPSDLLDRENPSISLEGADFLLWKEPPLVDRYVELLNELKPQNIFELGVMEGGSTAFLSEFAQPRRLVAIDRRAPMNPALRNYLAREEHTEVVRLYADVDQADRNRLAEIVEEEFGDEPLDLVVDDCSHLYEPTRASFNELFPRLRPGGLYSIEDWRWAHALLGEDSLEGMWPDEVPLTRLVFELTLALASVPGMIDDIRIETGSVQVWRGSAELDPQGFEISDCYADRGRRLLAD